MIGLTVERLTKDVLFVLRHLYSADASVLQKKSCATCLAARFFAYMQNHTECDPLYRNLSWDPNWPMEGRRNAKHFEIPLVLHRRENEGEKVLAIGFSASTANCNSDMEMIANALQGDHGYQFGLQIVFGIEMVALIWFKDGRTRPFSYEKYRTSDWKLDSFLEGNRPRDRRRAVTLMITRNCNLQCSYCYEPFKCRDKTKEMTFETAKKILQDEFALVENSADYDEIEIDFMGGEPFMNFTLIKQVVEWLERDPPPVPYICFATTNGTLVHKHERWLRAHSGSFRLGGSYDGTAKMQQTNRGTGRKFYDNTKLLHDLYPDQGFHMVISKETLPSLADGVLSIQREGYLLMAALAQGVDWDDRDATIYSRELTKLAKAYLGKDKELKPINLLTRPLMTIADDPETVEQKKFCGTGRQMVTYDYDGTPYGCHLFTPVVLGENATPLSRVDYDCTDSNADPFCAKCHLKGVCPTCPGFNYRYRGSLGLRDHRWCCMVAAQMKIACMFQIKKLARLRNHTSDELAYARFAYEAHKVLKDFRPSTEKERR